VYYVYIEFQPKFNSQPEILCLYITPLHSVSYIEVPQDIVGAGAYNTTKVGPSLAELAQNIWEGRNTENSSLQKIKT
jgi:hypothetical protein